MTDLFSTSSDQILALLRFTVENTGTESAPFGSESFSMSGGAFITDLRGYQLSTVTGIEGSPLNDVSVEAGQRIDGWLLAQVSRKQAKNGATVGWQRDTIETLPERSWTVKPAKLPSFSLDQWAIGSKQVPGKYTHKFTVKNTSKIKSTFRGALDYKWNDDEEDEWEQFQTISAKIPPGKTKTFDIQETTLYLGTLNYRVRPFDTTKSVTIQTPKLSFGEKTRIPDGTIRVSKVQTHPSYTTEGEYTGTEKHIPDDGAKFVFAYVEFVPNSDDVTNMPDDNHFTLRANGTRYSESGDLPGPMASPVKGRFYYQTYWSSNVRAGDPWAGWISFEVPKNVNASNVTIAVEKEYDYGGVSRAEWSTKGNEKK